jgi:transcription antitermination factor NusB
MSELKVQSTELRDHLREQISFWRSDLGIAKLSFSQVKKRQQLEKIWEDDSLWSEVHQTLETLLRYQGSIDTLISQSSLRWKLGRMGNVDRAVLRLGTYELCFHENLPARALLNEAVELGKRYGSAESGRFINGVLDRVAQDLARIEKRSESGGISVSVVHRKR